MNKNSDDANNLQNDIRDDRELHNVPWGKVATMCFVLMGCVMVVANGYNNNYQKAKNSKVVPMLGGKYGYPCTLSIRDFLTRNMQDPGDFVEITPKVFFSGSYIPSSGELEGIPESSGLIGLEKTHPEMQNIKVNSPSDYIEIHTRESDTFGNDWSHTPRISDICNSIERCTPGYFAPFSTKWIPEKCSRNKRVVSHWKTGTIEYDFNIY